MSETTQHGLRKAVADGAQGDEAAILPLSCSPSPTMNESDHSNSTHWQIAVDTGGTFTDLLAVDPAGREHRAKVLSSGALRGRIAEVIDDRTLRIEQSWGGPDDLVAGWAFSCAGETRRVAAWNVAKSGLILDGSMTGLRAGMSCVVQSDEPAPIVAARIVTGTPSGHALPPMAIRLGTTRGTNALLTRSGGRVALFITGGFADLLHIGTQQRPDLFALNIVKPEPLFDTAIEVQERIDSGGALVCELDERRLLGDARAARAAGAEVAAVCLMNSVHNDEHERCAANVLREAGFEHVVCSTDIARSIRIVPRAQTTVVDAYLNPVISDYLNEVHRPTGANTRLHVMTSAGGLVAADQYRPVDSLLSGPAGGVAGAAAVARECGIEKIISFDMGGTSTDVARFDGDFDYEFEHTVGDARIMAPALAIHTVAAGGGSICRADDGRLVVGPESGGADPGPACYGMGGPLTITDVNLLSGRIDPDRFEIPLDRDASEAALNALRDELCAQTGRDIATEIILDGLLAIANQRMAHAIEQISLRKGYDPTDYAMVSFGGAGGQHACAIASLLGISEIVMPADASILSAVGIAHATIERFSQRQVLAPLDDIATTLNNLLAACETEATDAVSAEGVDPSNIHIRRRLLNLRLHGQDATLTIEATNNTPSIEELRNAFTERFQAMYGHTPPARPIEVESIRIIASAIQAEQEHLPDVAPMHDAVPSRRCSARFDGEWQEVPAFNRDDLQTGDTIRGPAIVFSRRSSFVIEAGWAACYNRNGALRLQHEKSAELAEPIGAAADESVRSELFTNRFTAIADEMGRMLERAAFSTNVKERLDFSCTLLDTDGYLVVNAPHMPVHLGAMGLCVRSVRDAIAMRPGDVVVTNHPAHGGSHLPDITVITPVFDGDGALAAYVGNRCHHAELGGTRPGSMPPDATTLAEEGVVITPRYLIEQGEERFDKMEAFLRSGASGGPSRSVEENLADLRAAIASNQRGVNALHQLLKAHGRDEVQKQMHALRKRATRCAADALGDLEDGVYEAEERLDDGAALKVAITIDGGRAMFDFTGTSPRHPGNLNATPAIVRSAVMYVLRLMVGERLPLNEGLLDVVEIVLPRCMLNPQFVDDPTQCPAVVGGNVETSQRLVDTLLKALGLCACSQGTMNNVLFGTEKFGYYETICGGAGAGDGFDGADAVHTHMTNTRITDPEIIEHRYPVRVERFAIRRGSGGEGKHHGGDGATREFTFLQPMSLSVLTQHRVERPFGLHGGEPGQAGRQRVVRADCEVIELNSVDGCEVLPGDRFIIETPGGGGWGLV